MRQQKKIDLKQDDLLIRVSKPLMNQFKGVCFLGDVKYRQQLELIIKEWIKKKIPDGIK